MHIAVIVLGSTESVLYRGEPLLRNGCVLHGNKSVSRIGYIVRVYNYFRMRDQGKKKNIAVTDLKMSRISHFLDNRLTDGGKVVNPTHRPLFTLQKHFLALISVRG
jgi:hypothetical protein